MSYQVKTLVFQQVIYSLTCNQYLLGDIRKLTISVVRYEKNLFFSSYLKPADSAKAISYLIPIFRTFVKWKT